MVHGVECIARVSYVLHANFGSLRPQPYFFIIHIFKQCQANLIGMSFGGVLVLFSFKVSSSPFCADVGAHNCIMFWSIYIIRMEATLDLIDVQVITFSHV